MPYWHALLALPAFGLTVPRPICVDLRKIHFPIHEGMWTPTSPSHQPKASHLCSESAGWGLSTEFQHCLEVSSFWDLWWGLPCFVKTISLWWREEWEGGDVIWLREPRREWRIPIMLCGRNYHVLIPTGNQTLKNMWSGCFLTLFFGPMHVSVVTSSREANVPEQIYNTPVTPCSGISGGRLISSASCLRHMRSSLSPATLGTSHRQQGGQSCSPPLNLY